MLDIEDVDSTQRVMADCCYTLNQSVTSETSTGVSCHKGLMTANTDGRLWAVFIWKVHWTKSFKAIHQTTTLCSSLGMAVSRPGAHLWVLGKCVESDFSGS